MQNEKNTLCSHDKKVNISLKDNKVRGIFFYL